VLRPAVFLTVQILASVLMGFRADVDFPRPGLDASYEFAVNYASVHGWRWGEEFVTTYGPLGWLLVPVDMADVAFSWFVGQVVLVFALAAVVTIYVWSLPGVSLRARYAMGFMLLYLADCLSDEYRWLILFLLLFLLGLHDRTRIGQTSHVLASLLAGIYLLVKFSLGSAAILTLAVGCFLLWPAKLVFRRLVVTVASASIGLSLAWAAHYRTLSGIPDHLAMSFSCAAGYSSAMSVIPEGWELSVLSYLVAVGLIVAWVLLRGDRRTLLSLVGMAAPLFVAWKHAIVRQDNHEGYFVLFGYMAVAVLIAESSVAGRRLWTTPVILGALMALTFPWFHDSVIDPPRRYLRISLARPLDLPGIQGLSRFLGLGSYRRLLAAQSADALEALRLPELERALLGNSTVDVYPWETAYVPANGLKWRARPVPGSFSSYTPALDRLNAAFFESPNRPQWLLWHIMPGLSGLDRRHLFWDEPLTMLEILRRYVPVRTGPVFLLKARDTPRSVSMETLSTDRAPWGEWVPVPDREGVMLAQIELRRPLIASVRRLLFREKPAFIWARLSSGHLVSYRFAPDQAASGLWISPLPGVRRHLSALLRGRLPAQARVTAIRLDGGWAQHATRPPSVTWLRLRFDSASPRTK
jgi:hypothetical protein